MDVKETGCEDVDWSNGGFCKHDDETSVSIKVGNFLTS